MHQLKGFEGSRIGTFTLPKLWILLTFLPHWWTMPQSAESVAVVSKKGVVASKLPYNAFPTMAEMLRSDFGKMRSTLERMANSLEKLETLLPRRHDELGDILEHTMGNALRNITNPSMKILSEKLERVTRVQERNSRLINTQMEWLTSLEERLESFTNFHRGTSLPGDDIDTPSFTPYQRQIVEWLTSIDKKLDGVTMQRKVDGDKENGRKDHWSGKSLAEKKFDEVYNESATDHDNVIKIAVPSCEALKDTRFRSGVYALDQGEEFVWGNTSAILCDTTTNGGGWTVIQKRGPRRGEAVNFTRSWNDYANGFGNLLGEFWLGNEIVHRMTFYYGPHELRIELEDWEGERVWAQYSNFELRSAKDNYRVKVAGYSGNATDSLSAHDSTLFSTFDRRNDLAPRCCPCTSDYGGGWWYYSCFESNLNGDYYEKDQYRRPFRGIIWEHWRGNYSLKSTVMMVRSRKSYMKEKIQRAFRDPVTSFPAL